MKINENALIGRVFNICEFLFKICFLIYGFMSFNSFFIHTKAVSVILILTIALAGIALVYRLINFKHFIHNKMLWLAAALTGSWIVTRLRKSR